MKQIPLTKGGFAIVDDEDYNFLNQWTWRTDVREQKRYAYRVISMKNAEGKKINKVLFMHRLLLNVSDPIKIVDHIDRDKLNNQKSNLRIVTSAQSTYNLGKIKSIKTTSIFKGVSWCADRQKWQAYISVNDKMVSLGRHNSESDAALAYNKRAISIRGEYAGLNSISIDNGT